MGCLREEVLQPLQREEWACGEAPASRSGLSIIQTRYQYSDRELIDQLTENLYYQYFIGLPKYQKEPPINASTLVLFRKRLKMNVIMETNEYMLSAFKEKATDEKHKDDGHIAPPTGSYGNSVEVNGPENKGTLMLDVTCAPSNIHYPQDFSLLNEAREKLETIIICFCKDYSFS